MSQFTNQLQEFALRLKKDGYPTALVERAAERMEAMEDEIVRLHTQKSMWYRFKKFFKAR